MKTRPQSGRDASERVAAIVGMRKLNHKEARVFRVRGIKRSVFSSLGSKVVTVGVQLIAIPVAFEALGATRFGIYLMITSVLGWM